MCRVGERDRWIHVCRGRSVPQVEPARQRRRPRRRTRSPGLGAHDRPSRSRRCSTCGRDDFDGKCSSPAASPARAPSSRVARATRGRRASDRGGASRPPRQSCRSPRARSAPAGSRRDAPASGGWRSSSATATRAPRTRSSDPTAGSSGTSTSARIGVGDRWADLAIASMSLDWNYGDGFQDQFFRAYGVVARCRAHPLLPGARGTANSKLEVMSAPIRPPSSSASSRGEIPSDDRVRERARHRAPRHRAAGARAPAGVPEDGGVPRTSPSSPRVTRSCSPRSSRIAQQLADEHADGEYRLIFNTGAGAGQTVFHVHAHVLGRRLDGGDPLASSRPRPPATHAGANSRSTASRWCGCSARRTACCTTIERAVSRCQRARARQSSHARRDPTTRSHAAERLVRGAARDGDERRRPRPGRCDGVARILSAARAARPRCSARRSSRAAARASGPRRWARRPTSTRSTTTRSSSASAPPVPARPTSRWPRPCRRCSAKRSSASS